MKKRQRKKNGNLKRAIRIVFNKMRKMSDEKLYKLLEDNEPTCKPDTCEGECQGMGWCDMATKFREEEIHKIMQERAKMVHECNPWYPVNPVTEEEQNIISNFSDELAKVTDHKCNQCGNYLVLQDLKDSTSCFCPTCKNRNLFNNGFDENGHLLPLE